MKFLGERDSANGDKAFNAVKDLPVQDRLVIAVDLNDTLRWMSGHIDDNSVTAGFDDSVRRAVSDYREGAKAFTVVIRPFGGGHVIVAMGADSPLSIIEALIGGVETIALDRARKE